MRCELARRADPAILPVRQLRSGHRLDAGTPDRSGAQQTQRLLRHHGNDGRLDPVLARPAVENHRDIVAPELRRDVPCRRRAEPPGRICRRRGQRPVAGRQKLPRNGMSRHPQTDRIETRAGKIAHRPALADGNDERQRPRPQRARESLGTVVEQTFPAGVGRRPDVSNQRIEPGSVFRREYPGNGLRVSRVCRQTVDRFGRQADEQAVGNGPVSRGKTLGIGLDNRYSRHRALNLKAAQRTRRRCARRWIADRRRHPGRGPPCNRVRRGSRRSAPRKTCRPRDRYRPALDACRRP